MGKKLLSTNRGSRNHYTFFTELLKNAPPHIISEFIFKLNITGKLRIFESRHVDKIVKLVLESRTSGAEIVKILRAFESIYSDDLLYSPNNMELIRRRAFHLDDEELALFTCEIPGLLSPINNTLLNLMREIIHPKLPKLWNLVLKDPHPSQLSYRTTSETYCKFKTFSQPINVKYWSAPMFALACGNYEECFSLPEQLCQPKNFSGRAKDSEKGHITDIYKLIPLIPDSLYRLCARKKFKLNPDGENEFTSQFEYIDAKNQKVIVRVIPSWEQSIEPDYVKPISSQRIETDSFVNEILIN